MFRNNEEYISNCEKVANEKLGGYSDFESIAADEEKLNKYENIDSLEDPIKMTEQGIHITGRTCQALYIGPSPHLDHDPLGCWRGRGGHLALWDHVKEQRRHQR